VTAKEKETEKETVDEGTTNVGNPSITKGRAN